MTQGYQAYWGIDKGRGEYQFVILARAPLTEIAKRAVDPKTTATNAPVVAFSTYGRDSIWATSFSFIWVPRLSDVTEKSLTLHDDFNQEHRVQITKATGADLRRLIAKPEGTIPISRIMSPVHCREDMAFLNSIAASIAD